MILRLGPNVDLPLFLLLLSVPMIVASSFDESPSFNCHFQIDKLKYDLTSLVYEEPITRDRKIPPTLETDSVRLSLCSDLKSLDGVPEADQCPSGTRVCLTKINKKDGESDRVVSVIPIAQTSQLDPSYYPLSSPKGVSLLLHGGVYPHPVNTTEAQQSVIITVLCEKEASPPEFVAYDGALLEIKWSGPAGCGSEGDDGHENEGDDPGNQKSGGSLSSLGWFMLLLLLAFVAYMGLGAYYNMNTYGATGLDLIPHRDFWMEVPYLLKDVISHLCSVIRPRRTANHRGYHAV